MVVEFVLSAGGYLMLLPAVLSLIPGVLNGCLRIKALMPAAQLPGWLLIWVAPAFLLFWLVILVLANHVARSPLLVLGVLFWAGSPIWYSLFGKVFVQSQISDEDATKIARVKGVVTLFAVGGSHCWSRSSSPKRCSDSTSWDSTGRRPSPRNWRN